MFLHDIQAALNLLGAFLGSRSRQLLRISPHLRPWAPWTIPMVHWASLTSRLKGRRVVRARVMAL